VNPDRRQWFGRRAVEWVLDEAGDIPPTLVATLVGLARHAQNDGTGAAPSVETLVAYTRKSRRQVKYDLDKLRELKLIRESDDQSRVAHIRADRRPTVYDLAMPSGDTSGCNPLHPEATERGATDCTSQLPRGAMGGSTGCNTASNGVQPIAPEENYEKNLEKNNPSLSPDRPLVPAPRTSWPTNRERDEPASPSTPKDYRHRLVAKYGAPEDKVDYVIEYVERIYGVDGVGWWVKAESTKTVRDRVVEALNAWDTDAADPTGASTERRGRPDWCGQCDEHTRQEQRGGDHGEGMKIFRCPRCHPLTQQPRSGERKESTGDRNWRRANELGDDIDRQFGYRRQPAHKPYLDPVDQSVYDRPL
jgi:hypothetical protein